MAENPVLAGQSSKGYNIYNYSITPDLASFLKNQVNSIPQGFYKTREGSYSIDDELIQKSINYTLGYSDIDRYFSYYVRDGIISAYNIYQVNSFIFSYINQVIQSGGEMEDRKNVINKAFYNGKELADQSAIACTSASDCPSICWKPTTTSATCTPVSSM